MKFQPFALIPCLLFTACQMPDSPIDDPNYAPKYSWDNTDKEDEDIDSIKEIVAPEAPVLEALPSLYYYDSIPVRGKAAAGTDVLVSSSEKGVVAGMVDRDGTFCVDLPLARNKTQTIKVRVHNGLFSEFATTTIAQEYFGPAEEPEITVVPDDPYATPEAQYTLENIAFEKSVYIAEQKNLQKGFLSYLTDGQTTADNPNNYVELLDRGEGGSAMVWVNLGENHQIYMVEVVLNPNGVNGYPDEIKVFTSTAVEVAKLEKETSWDVTTEGDSLKAVYPAKDSSESIMSASVPIILYDKPQARHVGFEINYKLNIFNKRASVSELRIYERRAIEPPEDEDDPPSPVEGLVTPTCGNGKRI